MKEYCVAVTGALGAVGQEMLSILESRQFPIKKLKLLDIAENVGKTVKFCGKEVSVELLCVLSMVIGLALILRKK